MDINERLATEVMGWHPIEFVQFDKKAFARGNSRRDYNQYEFFYYSEEPVSEVTLKRAQVGALKTIPISWRMFNPVKDRNHTALVLEKIGEVGLARELGMELAGVHDFEYTTYIPAGCGCCPGYDSSRPEVLHEILSLTSEQICQAIIKVLDSQNPPPETLLKETGV